MEIIPVIHVLDNKQVFKNIDTCLECGIKKVFLICHSGYNHSLINLANTVKAKSNLWVGINLLGYETQYLLTDNNFYDIHLDGIDALWCDDGLTNLDRKIVLNIKQRRQFKGLFFGGLAFKYQYQPIDLAYACANAKIITDVATTSGEATGKAPTVVKIQNLRNLLGTHPMAIASGISAENIKSFSGLVQYVLVASSITDSHELIIKDKLIELINAAKI